MSKTSPGSGFSLCARALGAVSLIAVVAAAGPGWAAEAASQAQTKPTPKAAPKPAPKPAKKAAAPADDDDDAEVSAVTVNANARPQQGAAITDIKPELQLSPAQIQSYGVSTISELLDELGPQLRSDAGRGDESTVVLLNGRRISGFAEIRDIPTEAILRVDILPEEAALRYGYTADQRVVNIVLRRRFRANTVEATGGGPTDGGQINGNVQGTQTRIRGDNRMNLSIQAKKSTDLTEDERGLEEPAGRRPYDLLGNITGAGTGAGAEIDPALSALVGRPVTVAGVPAGAAGRPLSLSDFASTAGILDTSELGRYRSLSPATQSVALNGVLSRVLSHGISATVNATLDVSGSDSEQGLPGVSLGLPAGDPYSPFTRDVVLNRYVDALGPLRQSTDNWAGHLGGALNKDFGTWRSSLTATYDHADSFTVSDVGVDASIVQALLNADDPGFNPFGPLSSGQLRPLSPTKARSITDSAGFVAQTAGPLFKMPAGKANLSLKAGDTYSALDSRSTRFGMEQALDLSRNDFNARASFDLPLTSRSAKVLPWIGDVSLNGNIATDQVSDVGSLFGYGYGVRWTPVTGLRLLVTKTHDERAPSAAQLVGPTVATEGARVFDFLTGQTVDVTRITGGNPALVHDKRDTLKLNLSFKPFSKENLTFTANYVDTRITNPIQSITSSAALEEAFADRFIRDEDGVLTSIDTRPVNFARQDKRELRWGVNFTHTVGKPPPPPTPEQREEFRRRFEALRAARQQQQQQQAQKSGQQTQQQTQQRQRQRDDGPPEGPPPEGGPPPDGGPPPGELRGGPGGGGPGGFGGGGRGFGGGGGGRGGGGFGGGPGANTQGQVQFALYHTVIFEDELLVRAGGPIINRLNGDSGGEAQHEVEIQAGYSAKGLGARISGDWKSGYSVRAGPLSPTGDLNFSSLATLNLRLFANLAGMPGFVRAHPWARGARVTFNVTNLFNQRIQVRDATGSTPLGYQPAYLDPVGRTVNLSIRKLFI